MEPNAGEGFSPGRITLPDTLPDSLLRNVISSRYAVTKGTTMAKTTAQRQAEYRKRALTQGNGARRLNLWISSAADMALGRLIDHGGGTKRAVLERLILEADKRITEDSGASYG